MQSFFSQNIDLAWVTSAAVLAFVGSLTIALVNAIAARRLERAKALRAYRAESIASCRALITESAVAVGNYRTQFKIRDWTEFRNTSVKWMIARGAPDEKFGAVYLPGSINPAFLDANKAQMALSYEVTLMHRGHDTDAQRQRVESALVLVLDALSIVERRTELYVYGGGPRMRLGLRYRNWRFRRTLSELLRTRAPLPKE